ERRRGVSEIAADPVLRAAPSAAAWSDVAGSAVQSRAVRRVVERSGPPGAAQPAGGRRRPLALMAGQATRRRRAAGEMELPSGPRGERTARVASGAFGGRGQMIELQACGQRRVR